MLLEQTDLPDNKMLEQSLILHCTHGFMQDKIIASHTCFGGHMDVNC